MNEANLDRQIQRRLNKNKNKLSPSLMLLMVNFTNTTSMCLYCVPLLRWSSTIKTIHVWSPSVSVLNTAFGLCLSTSQQPPGHAGTASPNVDGFQNCRVILGGGGLPLLSLDFLLDSVGKHQKCLSCQAQHGELLFKTRLDSFYSSCGRFRSARIRPEQTEEQ